MVRYFCYKCFKEIKADEIICPFCGAEQSEYDRKMYIEKLEIALNNPRYNNAMDAIFILGELKSRHSIELLNDLYQKTNDLYMKANILEALIKIDSEFIKNFKINSSLDKLSVLEINVLEKYNLK